MPADIEVLLLRLIGGDATAPDQVLECAQTSASPALLVAAALVTQEADASAGFLDRAAAHAANTRDRQLVAIATAYLAEDADLLDALVRDHLADHPNHVFAAWIASQRTGTTIPTYREDQ
jgi:hypothetical protein